MSDFSSDFGAFYVGIITVVSMLAWAVLLYNRIVSTVPATAVTEER